MAGTVGSSLSVPPPMTPPPTTDNNVVSFPKVSLAIPTNSSNRSLYFWDTNRNARPVSPWPGSGSRHGVDLHKSLMASRAFAVGSLMPDRHVLLVGAGAENERTNPKGEVTHRQISRSNKAALFCNNGACEGGRCIIVVPGVAVMIVADATSWPPGAVDCRCRRRCQRGGVGARRQIISRASRPFSPRESSARN